MVTIFRNSTHVENGIYVTVDKALERIKNGWSKIKVQSIRECTDKELRNKLKETLPCVLFSGKFPKRGNDFCSEQSKFICLDFDYVSDVSLIKKKFIGFPYVYAAWISPSGKGVKVLVKVSTTNHSGHFLALQETFPELDKACKDLARICYESYDEDIYINTSATEYTNIYIPPKVVTQDKKSPDYVFECLKTWLQNKGQSFVEGNRNNYVFCLAAACNRVGLSQSDCEFNIIKYISGIDFQEEARKIVQGVYKRYAKDFSSHEFTDNEVINKTTKENTNETIFNFDDTSGDIVTFSNVLPKLLDIFRNGITKGDSTYFPEIDERFRWMRGQFNVMHGIGNFGKTTLFQQMALIKSLKDNTKWMFFSPEQMPAEIYFKDLIQSYYGKTANKNVPNSITEQEILDASDFFNEHFVLICPQKKSPTPDYVLERFFEGIIKYDIDGAVIDPFNQMTNNYKEFTRSDQYLEHYLSKLKLFTKNNNIYFTLLTHPTNPPRPVQGEDMIAPDVWNISGGAMWNNIADNILCYHRPKHHIDKSDTTCQFISQKIRHQQMNGIPGVVNMQYNRETFRFYINGKSPFEQTKIEITPQGNLNYYEPAGEDEPLPF